jgi:hypothetical protein
MTKSQQQIADSLRPHGFCVAGWKPHPHQQGTLLLLVDHGDDRLAYPITATFVEEKPGKASMFLLSSLRMMVTKNGKQPR